MSPNAACISPVEAFGWNAICPDGNPVSAEIASRTLSFSACIRSTVPKRALASASYCPSVSARTVADSGPTRP